MSILPHMAKLFNTQVLRLGSDIEYYQYSPSTTKNIYNETLGIQYLLPISLRCIYKMTPTKEELEEFGLTESVDVVFRIPMLQLEDEQVVPKLRDKIVFKGTPYFVKDKNTEGNVNNQSVFISIGCTHNVFTDG